jgi:hypothetical protein
MVISRRSLLLAGVALPVAAHAQCVTDTPSVDACKGGVRITTPPGLSLDLNFMIPGTLDPRITFTRASTATYFDSSGVMQTAATNAPRWDYNPSTRALNGLLIEEARTNLAPNSGDASNASWTKTGITVAAPTVTGNQTVAPDGTTTAARVVMPAVPAAGNASYVNPVIMILTTQPYSLSVWLKGNVGGEQLYLSATPDGSTYFRLPVTLTTSWQRFTLTTANLTGVSWYLIVGTDRRDAGQSATLAQTFFIWGAQLEQGAFPTSYIPTTAASVTRAIEVANITPLGAWNNVNAGSLVFEFDTNNSACVIGGMSDGTFANVIYLDHGTSGVVTNIASVGQSVTSNPVANGVVQKMSCAWSPGRLAACNNGASVAVNAALSASPYPWTTNLCIGNAPWAVSNNSTALDGHARRVRYWPRALTNAELQSVTT